MKISKPIQFELKRRYGATTMEEIYNLTDKQLWVIRGVGKLFMIRLREEQKKAQKEVKKDEPKEMHKRQKEILADFGITETTKHHSYDYLYKSMLLAMEMYAMKCKTT